MKHYQDDFQYPYNECYSEAKTVKELLDKPIWGFAYNVNDDTERKKLGCVPILGEIAKNTTNLKGAKYCFFPYKKGTTERRKGGVVDYQCRIYADTYVEAAEMYNELVDARIKNLERMIDEAKKERL